MAIDYKQMRESFNDPSVDEETRKKGLELLSFLEVQDVIDAREKGVKTRRLKSIVVDVLFVLLSLVIIVIALHILEASTATGLIAGVIVFFIIRWMYRNRRSEYNSMFWGGFGS